MKNIRVLLLNPVPSLIKYGIKWGFEKNNCFVHLMEDIYLLRSPNEKSLVLQKIENAITEYDINFLFTEGYSNMPVREIKNLCEKHNVKMHWWAIEDPVTPLIGENIAKNKLADFIWTTTTEFIDKYKRLGVDSDLLLFGCNPDFQKPTLGESRFEHDISVVGTNYSNRYDKTKEFIFPLIENNFDIKIYGLWWMNPNIPVNLIKYKDKNVYWEETGYQQLPYEWLPIVINSSKIMIGLNCSDYSATQTSCRPFETLCASKDTIYLAYHTKAQDNIFGDYIVQAKTGKEMIEKAQDILTWSKEKRTEFATKARKYVSEKHSYAIRAKTIIEKL